MNKLIINTKDTYEEICFKIQWKYTSNMFSDNLEIIKLYDLKRKNNYCNGIELFITNFINILKDNVIRFLPNLKKIKITLEFLDKNNLFHKLFIESYNLICDILKQKLKINFYKTIFVTVKYEDRIVFIGNLSFDNII